MVIRAKAEGFKCQDLHIAISLPSTAHSLLVMWIIFVLYYGQYATCEYLEDGDFTKLLNSWPTWTTKEGVADHTPVFLGLVSSSDKSAASYGYISPEDLKSKVLPTVMESSNFGGVMLWNRCYDKLTGYSAKIKDALGPQVCQCEYHDAAPKRLYSLLAKSM